MGQLCTLPFDLNNDLNLEIFKVKFWNNSISWIVGLTVFIASQQNTKTLGCMSEVKGQGHRGQNPILPFWTITPVWIHIYRRGGLLFFKVICQISRSHRTKKLPVLTQIGRFLTVNWVWIDRWLWNDVSHMQQKIVDFHPNWAFPDCNYRMMHTAWHSKEEVPYHLSKVSRQIQGHTRQKSLILTRIVRFWTPLWIYQWLRNDAQSLK